MVCKLLHCEYRASESANYQNMPLQCIVFSGLACSQHAIKLILVSDEADLRVDSNDLSPMCIPCKTKKLFKLLLGSSQHEQSIVAVHLNLTHRKTSWMPHNQNRLMSPNFWAISLKV